MINLVAAKTFFEASHAAEVMAFDIVSYATKVKECAAAFFGLFYGCPYNAVGRGYFAKVIA